MRPKYRTEAIALGRRSLGESSLLLALLTRDFGLVVARAQGLRKQGARLAPALASLVESEATLVRGREGWRLSGAVLIRPWFRELPRAARVRAARIAGLLLRLVGGESSDPRLYTLFSSALAAFFTGPPETHEAVEHIAVLRLLSALGFDTETLPPSPERDAALLGAVSRDRAASIARINRGIEASGL